MNYYDDVLIIYADNKDDADNFDKDWEDLKIKSINISNYLRFDTNYDHALSLRNYVERQGLYNPSIGNIDNPQIPILFIVHQDVSEQYQQHFDTSRWIYHLVVLTLLEKPIKINLNNSGRIFFSNKNRDDITEIIPSFYPDTATIFWAPRQDDQKDYLLPDDIDNIKKLWGAFKIQDFDKYPPRFRYALGWFSMTKLGNIINHSFLTSVIALECLLTIGDKFKGNQLTKRIDMISQNNEFKEYSIKEDEANKIWKVRCQMVHSAEQFDKIEPKDIEKLYSKVEGFLRTFLKKAILDDSFMSIIKTPDSIKKEWPVKNKTNP